MNFAGYLVMIFISIVFMLAGTLFLQINLYRIRSWTKTKAIVIEHEEGFDESASVYAAIVKFKIENKDVIARSSLQSSFPPKIGKQIVIFYDPDDPNTYIPFSMLSLYAAPCVFFIVGVLPIGTVVYYFLTGD